MSSVDHLEPGNEYECDRVYTDAEKRRVTPGELICWLNIPTFGDPDPAPDLVIKPLVHANTVAFWKKALSHARSATWLANWQQ